MLIIRLLLLFCGLLLPAVCGYPLGSLMFKGRKISKFEVFIFSFLLGWMVFSAIFAVSGFLRIGFSVTGGLFVLTIIWGACSLLNRYYGKNIQQENIECEDLKVGKESGVQRWGRSLLIIFSILIFLLFCLDSCGEWSSFGMSGVWGYKAKLFYYQGSIPVSFFCDKELLFTHQSYPLLYPVMLTWLYFCMGGVYDIALKFIPPLFALFVYLSLYQISRKEGSSHLNAIMLCLLYIGGSTFFLTSTTLYAENLLILYELWGIYFLFCFLRDLSLSNGSKTDFVNIWAAILLFGGGACVKNEGSVYFLLAFGFIAAYLFYAILIAKRPSQRKLYYLLALRVFAILLLVSTVFILPWLLFRYYLDIQVRDFSVFGKMNMLLEQGTLSEWCWEILKTSFLKFLDEIFINLKNSCGLWYFLILILLFLKKRIFRPEILFLLWMICCSILLFTVSFIFSTRPLGWHMDAIPRLLLIPAFSAWLIICTGVNSKKK